MAGPASGAPAAARATNRRTLVSTTGWRWPYANAATARAVYVADARQRQQRVEVGRHHAAVPLDDATAHSRSRSARRG